MAQPSIHREDNGRKLVAAIGADRIGRNPRVGFKAGSNVCAGFHLDEKFVNRARPERMKCTGKPAQMEIGGRIIH
jgi:hypothetical protein